MSITRRGFLGCLASAMAVSTVPTQLFSVGHNGVISLVGKDIVLHRPLIIDAPNDHVVIRDCRFFLPKEYAEDHAISCPAAASIALHSLQFIYEGDDGSHYQFCNWHFN